MSMLSVLVRSLSALILAGDGELLTDGAGTVPALLLPLLGCLGGIGIPDPAALMLALDGLGAPLAFDDWGYGESDEWDSDVLPCDIGGDLEALDGVLCDSAVEADRPEV